MIPVQPISRDLRGFDLTAFVSALLEGMRHMTRHGELPADDTISTSPRGHRLIMQYTGADPELFLADMRREFDLGLDLSAPGHVDISEIERYFPGLVDVVAAKFRRQAAAAHERREMTIQVAGRLSAAVAAAPMARARPHQARGRPQPAAARRPRPGPRPDPARPRGPGSRRGPVRPAGCARR